MSSNGTNSIRLAVVIYNFKFFTDSHLLTLTFWNEFHKRRILNAMKIKPDTVFGEQDMKLYYNLVKGIKEKELEKLLKQREDSISKLQKIEAKRLRKSLKEAQK